MLMGPDDGGADHRVFIVRVIRQNLEKIRPNTARSPARETPVGVVPIAEALRHIPPWRAGAELPDHRLDKQPVAQLAVAPDMARPAGQQILDPGKLVVPQSVASHDKASFAKAPHESHFSRFANPLNDHRP